MDSKQKADLRAATGLASTVEAATRQYRKSMGRFLEGDIKNEQMESIAEEYLKDIRQATGKYILNDIQSNAEIVRRTNEETS